MNKWLAFVSLVLMFVGVSGCNTVEGFGKDLSKVGDKIEKSADKHK